MASSTGGESLERCSVDVAASPERVWRLVSDLPGMGRFSPESTGGRWVDGTGPQLGAVFVGRNARGRRRWSTRSRVVECRPGGSFAFSVRVGPLRVATWRYDIEPTGQGCRVTESWRDERGRLMALLGRFVTGVDDRREYARTSMETTLGRLKAAGEGTNVTLLEA